MEIPAEIRAPARAHSRLRRKRSGEATRRCLPASPEPAASDVVAPRIGIELLLGLAHALLGLPLDLLSVSLELFALVVGGVPDLGADLAFEFLCRALEPVGSPFGVHILAISHEILRDHPRDIARHLNMADRAAGGGESRHCIASAGERTGRGLGVVTGGLRLVHRAQHGHFGAAALAPERMEAAGM